MRKQNMKEIFPNIFRKIVEFEDKHALPRNLYIIKGKDRSLMIDTTYRYEHAWIEMNRMVQELSIDYKKLDLFITHNHPDHVGYVYDLQQLGVQVYMNPVEAELKTDILQCYLSKDTYEYVNLHSMGLTKERYPEDYDEIVMNLSRKLVEREEPYTFKCNPIYPGDTLSYGGYDFTVVNLSGHTIGQCGLYEEKKKLLFSGDQLVLDTVPIVMSQKRNLHLLAMYFQSMEEINDLYRDCTVLPCHNEIIYEPALETKRITESYLAQCQATYDVLKETDEWMVTRDIGVKVFGGRYMARNYDKVTFCTHIWSKTFACLEYMYDLGNVQRIEEDGIIYWRWNKE
ncbi:MAG: MBL fold metallo-hydrolase [Lachnospiraceae bacterium]|nr:MBL fold metallo-hydrolase [Lachnospiraceae bacterium]